jgi:hypothetical protein
VNDTGVTDRSFNARLGWDFTNGHEFLLKAEKYDADETGFGFVEPSAYDPSSSTRIALTYPFQKVDQYVAGYKGNNLGRSWVDSAETTCSTTDNNFHYGSLGDVVTPLYTGQNCSSGTTGNYNWTYPTGTDSFFFLVVGSDTVTEGSYGKRSDLSERNPANLCTKTYDLTDRCD